jgi:meckelin
LVTVTYAPISHRYIYPPLLTIEYAELKKPVEPKAKANPIVMELRVTFVTDVSDVYRDIGIALGVLGIVALMWGLVRTWIWARRRGSGHHSATSGPQQPHSSAVSVDAQVLVHLLVYCCASVANAVFLVFSVVSVAWFTVYRLQDEPLVFLPKKLPGNDETFFVVFFIMAFVFKAMEMALLVYDQSTVGLFFLDWERPLAVVKEDVIQKGGPDGETEGEPQT